MLIKLIAVEVNAVPGKKYRQIDVSYKSDKGETKGKKLMDFSVKKGLNYLLEGKAGDALEVTAVKNGEYWNWEAIAPASAESAAAPAASGGGKGYVAPARDFETKDERAARQVMIVRQSSISSAVSLLKTEKNIPSVEEVLKVAQAFEAFVMGKTDTQAAEAVVNMDDDIPY